MKPPKNAMSKSVPSRLINKKLPQLIDSWNEAFQKKLEELNVSNSFEYFVNGLVLFAKILFEGIQLSLSASELFTNKDVTVSEKYVLKIGERYKI